MMEFIYLAIGLVVGAVIAWLATNIGKKKVEGRLALSERMLQDEQDEKGEVLRERDQLRLQVEALGKESSEVRTQLAVVSTQLSASQNLLEEAKVRNDKEMQLRREQF